MLQELEEALKVRSEQLLEGYTGPKRTMTDGPTPPPPALEDMHSREGAKEVMIGADLVLEMCRRQLHNEDSERRASVERLMRHVPEVTRASIDRIASRTIYKDPSQ